MRSLQDLPKLTSPVAQRLLLVLIGALYPLGFAPFELWPVTLLSIGLLVNEVLNKVLVGAGNAELSGKHAGDTRRWSLFSIGWYWACGAFGVGVSWVGSSIYQYGQVPMLGALGFCLLLVLVLALIKACSFYLIGPMFRWFGQYSLVLILPFVWVVSEFIQTYLLNGFPWLFAGYSQIDGPLWLLATWVGVYGLGWFMLAMISCLVILIHLCLTSTPEPKRILRLYVYALMVLICAPLAASLIPQGLIEPARKTINIALVQPDIPQEKKWDRSYYPQIIDILYLQSRDHWDADLIVWPEGAIPAYQHQVEDITRDLNERARLTHTDLLVGIPEYDAAQKSSYAAVMSFGKYPQSYHKQVLVPLGEYVPMEQHLRGLIDFFDLPMSSFSLPTNRQQAMDFADYQVIPAVCYEIAYPDIMHGLVKDADATSANAKLIVVVSNDAWFGDSLGPDQHLQMVRMRALELGLPLIRSTNDGITAVVDARGTVIASLARHTQDTLAYTLPLASYQTPYRRFGLLGIYGLLAMSLCVFGVARLAPLAVRLLIYKD